PSKRCTAPICAWQRRTALVMIALKAICRSNAERLMALSTWPVAVCCSRASTSSRVSRTTSASGPEADELLWRTAFGALPLFSANVFRRRALTGSPPALERRLIAFPEAQDHANVGFHAADQIRKLRPAE